MAYQGNPGMNSLARVLAERMKKENDSPLVLDFGSIQEDGSLKTDTFPVSIPKSDYMVCRHVGELKFSTELCRAAGISEHEHDVFLPVIAPGDRVLVAWVQSEAVVIDVIVPADS